MLKNKDEVIYFIQNFVCKLNIIKNFLCQREF